MSTIVVRYQVKPERAAENQRLIEAVFVRYSVAQFLRFWLARLTYEQQAQTDRVVEAIKPPTD